MLISTVQSYQDQSLCLHRDTSVFVSVLTCLSQILFHFSKLTKEVYSYSNDSTSYLSVRSILMLVFRVFSTNLPVVTDKEIELKGKM